MQNEESDLLLMEHFLTSGDVYFDVGANSGMFLYKASQLTDESNIFAFEPIPRLYIVLKKIFKKANVFQIAFSNAVQSGVSFKIPVIKNQKYYSRGTLNTSYIEEGENDSKSIKVDISTIDKFIEEKGLNRVDMIKIDVEGHEFDVIKGAANTLKNLAPILQVEIEQRHHTYPISEIIDFIKRVGYECYYFNPELYKLMLLEVDPTSLQKKGDFKTINYINNFYFGKHGKLGSKNADIINMEIESLR